MQFMIESNKGSAGRSTGLSGCSKTVACVQSQTSVRKASDKVLWFFFLLQGDYPFLFPFRQWAAKWGVQQPRLHFHPGWASTANHGPADPGKTFDLVQWCAGHRQVQVRGIHTHSFSPVCAAEVRLWATCGAGIKTTLLYKSGSKKWHLPLSPPEILLGINGSLHFPEGKGCLIGFALPLCGFLKK